jgi:phosphonate C-P lyase system protein PhnH
MTKMTSTRVTAALQQATRDAQPIFRGLVDAISHPARPVKLHTTSIDLPTVLVPAAVLADVTSRVALIGPSDIIQPIGDALVRVTGCQLSEPADADLVISTTDLDPHTLGSLRRGTSAAPETAATVFIACDEIQGTMHATEFMARGPGAHDGRCCTVSGMDTALTWMVTQPNDFPCGIDIFIISADSSVVAIPRSNRVTLTGGV